MLTKTKKAFLDSFELRKPFILTANNFKLILWIHIADLF